MRKLREQKDCLNCGNIVEERYCSHCGQENVLPRESFKHIITHFITDYLHLDEKFWSSLKPLLFNPGFLTNNYNQGKRASYVHPFRLYIFITIVYFLVSPSTIGSNKKTKIEESKNVSAAEIAKKGEDTSSADQSLSYSTESDDLELSIGDEGFISSDTTIEQYHASQAKLTEDQRDGFIGRYMKERSIKAQSKGINLADSVNENFKKNTSKMIFFLLPMFALILMLLFRKEKLFYVEHFFHSVYIHSFFFIALSIFSITADLLPESFLEILNLIAIVCMLFYVFKSCMVVYKEHAIITSLKLVLVAGLYLVMLLVAVAGNAFVSFLML